MNYGSFADVKLLKHGKKVVERFLEKRKQSVVEINEMQFHFMSGKEVVAALFVSQEEYLQKNRKLYLYFVDLGKPSIEF